MTTRAEPWVKANYYKKLKYKTTGKIISKEKQERVNEFSK